MVPVLLQGFRRFNLHRMREAILTIHGDPKKLLEKISEEEAVALAKESPDKFMEGVKKLASILVDPNTNRQGLTDKQRQLHILEIAQKHLKKLKDQSNG